MRILIAHVPYQNIGGEDIHVEVLAKAYRELGHEVQFFPKERTGPKDLWVASFESLLPLSTSPEIESVYNSWKPHLIHVHNAFPLLGPRFFRWITHQKIPLIMTVHNHRFYCTNGLALRGGKVCKDCFRSQIPWRALKYNCNSQTAKTLYHTMAVTQLHTQDLYKKAVKKFIAPSPYIKAELVKWGIAEGKILNILNPVVSKTPESSKRGSEKIDVFYGGRLSSEKGIVNLLKVISQLTHVKFAIAGDGPLRSLVEASAKSCKNLQFYGPVDHSEVLRLISESRIGILPSICNEILPGFVLEVFCQGKICLVPDLESTRWFVDAGLPGRVLDTSRPEFFAKAILGALDASGIQGEALEAIRRKFSFDTFCHSLGSLLAEF